MSTITATPPPSPANFNDEPQIYITTASLQLKQNFEDYEWHTMVLTPTTPTPPEVIQPVAEAETEAELEPEADEPCQTACQQQPVQQERPPRGHQLWTPAELHGVPQTISTIVGNFMDSERYHSEVNQLMARQTTRV